MSLEDGDIVKMVIQGNQSQNPSPVVNVFWFQVANLTGVLSTPLDFEGVCVDVFTAISDVLQPIQTTTFTYGTTTLENMTNLIDYGSYTPGAPVTGVNPGLADVVQVAASFKLIRTNRVTRNGSKRVGGIAAVWVDDATGVSFSGSAECSAIEAVFKNPIAVGTLPGGTCDLFPVIVRRPASGLPVTVFQPVQDCAFRGWGSQNTRKRLL